MGQTLLPGPLGNKCHLTAARVAPDRRVPGDKPHREPNLAEGRGMNKGNRGYQHPFMPKPSVSLPALRSQYPFLGRGAGYCPYYLVLPTAAILPPTLSSNPCQCPRSGVIQERSALPFCEARGGERGDGLLTTFRVLPTLLTVGERRTAWYPERTE